MRREDREGENGWIRRMRDLRSAPERRVNHHFCTAKCVSRRQTCSAGVEPTGARARRPVGAADNGLIPVLLGTTFSGTSNAVLLPTGTVFR